MSRRASTHKGLKERNKRSTSSGSDEHQGAHGSELHKSKSTRKLPISNETPPTTDIADRILHGTEDNRETLSTSYSTKSYTDLAGVILQQIKEDKNECGFIIEKYDVDQHELLHLLERWMQHLILTYKERCEDFKIKLGNKWHRGELNVAKSSKDIEQRRVYEHIEKIIQWKQISQLCTKERSNKLRTTQTNVKEVINQLIDE